MTTDGVTYGWAIKYGNAEPVNLMICDVLPITSFGFEPDAYLGGVPSMKALKSFTKLGVKPLAVIRLLLLVKYGKKLLQILMFVRLLRVLII